MTPPPSPPPASPLLASAVAAHRDGRLDEAATLYRRILDADPTDSDALHLLGLVRFHDGAVPEALELIRRAVAANGTVALYHANLGRVARAAGRDDEAEAAFGRATALDPTDAAAWADLAGVLVARGRPAEALPCCRHALAIAPHRAEAHHNRALALLAMGRPADAEPAAAAACAAAPDFADAQAVRARALQELGRDEPAAAAYQRALALDPDNHAARVNLGNIRRAQGRADEAVADYRRVLQVWPDHPAALANLAVARHEQGAVGEALALYDRALRRYPNDAELRRNHAQALLLAGRFAEGWREYAWRWKTRHFAPLRRDLGHPAWDGRPLDGRSILVHAEQGYGDTIQFVRYVPMVAARGGHVVLEVPRRLDGLLARLDGVGEVVVRGAPLPPFDVHAPLLDLPRLFGTTVETVPANVPYLRPDPAAVARWAARLDPGDRRPRVGLAWRGSPSYASDRARSPGLAPFLALLRIGGVRFLSLQKGPGQEERAVLDPAGRIEDLGPGLGDFDDTAAAFANLDLIISSDTAVPHLAGALGLACWLALPHVPDWRWLLDRDRSPWYPTVRLYRQAAAGDWTGVVRRLAADLSAWSAVVRR